MKSKIIIIGILIFRLTSILSANNPNEEFRGVWIATINNIDWPSSPNLSAEEQKKEFISLLNLAEQYNLNAVILQVRPAADAFYRSETEPWSWFLTGSQGKAPDQDWDPMEWAIEECHSRQIEFHAWFNPFRVRNLGQYPLAPESFAAKNPQFTCEYDRKLFFDPGYPEVRNHLIKVISEVVSKYNIDAIHLDDYFYPYPIQNKPFPDNKSFKSHGDSFYPNKIAEWRRKNIDEFIYGLHKAIKEIKPNVELGISPFGIWRNITDDPEGSSGTKGMSSYDILFADVRKWLKEGWIDYVMPQLYWEQGNRYGDFKTMTEWWIKNSFGKALYIGQALYKSTNSTKNRWSNQKEITDQLRILRNYTEVNGFAFYSISHLKKISAEQSSLLSNNYLNNKTLPLNSQWSTSSALTNENTTEATKSPAKDLTLGLEVIIPRISTFQNKNIELPIASDITIKKNRKGWLIEWSLSPAAANTENLNYAIVSFKPISNGFVRTTEDITVNNQYFIHKKEKKRYKGKLFTIIVLNSKSETSNISKLLNFDGGKLQFNKSR